MQRLFEARPQHRCSIESRCPTRLSKRFSPYLDAQPGEQEQAKSSRGFISYAQLGINQLGAVYEGLMAYTGFFADRDLYEVAKDGDPADGTWVLPVADAEGYPDDVFVPRTDPITGHTRTIAHRRGSFVFRLSGRIASARRATTPPKCSPAASCSTPSPNCLGSMITHRSTAAAGITEAGRSSS